MAAPQIMLVEGGETGEESLEAALVKEGYQVHVFHSTRKAAEWVGKQRPDLLIFDAASMGANESGGCRQLRNLLGDTPIIHTRSMGASRDDGAKADVYLVHPFTSRKVLNRVRALLPSDQYSQELIRAGELTLFLGKPSVSVRESGERRLTPKQAKLLEVFLRHPNQVLDRRQLMQDVWDTDYIGDTRTLDVHIRWLREAIEEDPSLPKRIITVRGVGYIFKLSAGAG
ncbi:MAG: response regulator transcription factor [Chloroflexota bacterium]